MRILTPADTGSDLWDKALIRASMPSITRHWLVAHTDRRRGPHIRRRGPDTRHRGQQDDAGVDKPQRLYLLVPLAFLAKAAQERRPLRGQPWFAGF
jgi:hypothetical protein